MNAPLPFNESERLEALRATELLESGPEPLLDDLTRLAARLFNVPMAMVSLVDADRQVFKSRIGTSLTETPRDHAFCAHAILDEDIFIVPDASTDPRFSDNPLVVGNPFIRFYAGAPLITPEGHALGALCLVDTTARTLDAHQQDALRAIAAHTQRLLGNLAKRREESSFTGV